MSRLGNESNHVLDGLTVNGGLRVNGNLDVAGLSSTSGVQDSIDARGYGMLADGVTDDTQALQTALTAAGTAGGGSVWLPVGTVVTTGVTVPAGVWLRGQGLGSVLKLRAAANAAVVTLSGARARVSDLKIDGNAANQTTGFIAGVKFSAADCAADNVLVQDSFKYGFHAPNVDRPQIRNCRVVDSLYIGIYVETTGTVDVVDALVTGCLVDRASLGASLVEGAIKFHGVSGKKVLRPRIGLNTVVMPASPVSAACVCIETFGGVDNAVIVGNATSGGTIGVSIDTSDHVNVTGNSAIGPSLYGIEVVSSDSPSISGNTISGASLTTRGIEVAGAGSSSSFVSVSGNTVTGCVQYGIHSQGATQIVVAGNTVNCVGATSMVQIAAATYAAVTGNQLADAGLTTHNGVFFDTCLWVTATGNVIAGTDQNGVVLFATTAVTIRSFVFGNAIDIAAGNSVATQLSGGAALSTQSMAWGNSDGAPNLLNHAGNVRILNGTGTPESAQGAGIGSLYVRTDGGAVTTLYVKESGTGTTGWVAK